VLRSATDAVVCADQRRIITLWNLAAERLLGYSEAEAIGLPLTIIVPERFHDAHNAGILRASRSEPPRIIGSTIEVFARRRDGSEFPVELSLASWTSGDERFYSGVLRDISERREPPSESPRRTKRSPRRTSSSKRSRQNSRSTSRQVYDSIFAGRTEVRVESYRKMLTVFFSDIQGFTALTDMLEAEALSDLLNEYLSEMSAIATRFGGTVDKFIGDGVMIFFGDPDTRGHADDAIACVEMALAMQKRVRELQVEWHDRGVQQPLHVRIGINTGYCTVGNFGSEERLD
jgi:PAS domain S-box-containing protein